MAATQSGCNRKANSKIFLIVVTAVQSGISTLIGILLEQVKIILCPVDGFASPI